MVGGGWRRRSEGKFFFPSAAYDFESADFGVAADKVGWSSAGVDSGSVEAASRGLMISIGSSSSSSSQTNPSISLLAAVAASTCS